MKFALQTTDTLERKIVHKVFFPACDKSKFGFSFTLVHALVPGKPDYRCTSEGKVSRLITLSIEPMPLPETASETVTVPYSVFDYFQ